MDIVIREKEDGVPQCVRSLSASFFFAFFLFRVSSNKRQEG